MFRQPRWVTTRMSSWMWLSKSERFQLPSDKQRWDFYNFYNANNFVLINANIFYQVDVYDQLVSTVPEPSRLKISRRVLRKLLQIRDKQRLKFRWRRHFCVKWNIFLTNIFSAGMEMEERGWLDDCLVEAESWNWFDSESVPSHDNCWPGVWRTWWTDCCESSVSRETIHCSPHHTLRLYLTNLNMIKIIFIIYKHFALIY